jgi:hypothetical protein
VIVLHVGRIDTGRFEFPFLPGLHEKSARIAEYLRFDEQHIGNRSFREFHAAGWFKIANAL